jgi:YD repeat-containing protein
VYWVESVTRTVDSQSIVQYLDYDAQGRQLHVWGNGTYPVQYGYDALGRRTTMKTYRSPSGVDFTDSQWPTNAPETGDQVEITTWTLDPATGLLKAKTDGSGNAVDYEYTADGKLKGV